MAPDGTVPGPTRCQPTGPIQPQQPGRPGTPPPVVQPRPEDITWEQVLAESKDVAFPKLTVHVQPKDKTLVNQDTIVYTENNGPTTVDVPLVGLMVTVTADPTSYTWHFGDGTSKTTDTPGKPYPSKEITHKYMKRGNVVLSVTVNYDASFTVGPITRYLGDVLITGPSTPLLVREAVPVLVDPPR
ncbi:PKD domain-containing protein [Kribbella antibiotica]|nr:PKD domain-containing protein [Kribbella antibiotica]